MNLLPVSLRGTGFLIPIVFRLLSMSSPLFQAINQISEEKNISVESVIETIEAALAAAYRKDFGEKNQNIKVTFDPDSGEFDVFDVKTVVEDMELPTEEEIAAAAENPKEPEIGPDGLPVEEKRFNPKTEVMISEAKDLKKDAEIGEEIRTQLEVPAAFGRMAAQTAKQVIIQKLREAERNKLFNEFKDKERELVNATVQRREGRLVFFDLGHATGVMPPEDQLPNERYQTGDRLKVLVSEVRMTTRGPEIVVSRAHPEIIRRLFTFEIPEVASGVVKIHSVAREPGIRAKVAVSSDQENIDPIGSCIGQRGTRIQTVINELGGEKIDVIQYESDPEKFITSALSPAKVSSMSIDEETKTADVFVSSDQLSLAIGKGGQNVRLASRLTGWKLNIREQEGGEIVEGGEATPEDGGEEASSSTDESAE